MVLCHYCRSYLFREEIPHGLPPLRGIEYQIDFIAGASIQNQSSYRVNPKEIRIQVDKLLRKGFVSESLIN